jgi:peptidoglycan/xylan/chitin deacetylase (PgdA/CDA1 family)
MRRCAPLLVLLAACTAAPPPATPSLEVAVTVDDLPVHGPAFAGIDRVRIAERLLEAFKRHRLPPVYGFVNGKRVDDDPATEAVLRAWLSAGSPLGNHTWSHPSLHRTPVAEYLADLEKGEIVLKKLQRDEAVWKVFRYPFLHVGDTLDKRDTVRGYLREHGYAIAEVTIDADDWAFNPPFARCTERGDSAAIAALRAGFVETHVEELRRMRELTRQLVGRDVRHVLLLHVGAADADAMDDLLSAYEREGVRWVDLRTALADPFYAIDPHIAVRAGAAFPYVVAKARGVSAPPAIFARGLEERLERVCR